MKPVLLIALGILCDCSRSNNLLLGRVEATVGGRQVVVTDCYRTIAPPPQQISDSEWHYMPCRDADVWIRKGELEVNGRAYGKVGARDTC